jgi:hypothetical protein
MVCSNGSDPHVLAANDARFQQTKRRGKKKLKGGRAREHDVLQGGEAAAGAAPGGGA